MNTKVILQIRRLITYNLPKLTCDQPSEDSGVSDSESCALFMLIFLFFVRIRISYIIKVTAKE